MSILKKKKETELVEGETKKKKGIRWFGRFLKHHKKLVFLLCVVIIGSVVGVNLYNSGMKVPEQAAGIAYETMTLEKRDISNSISVTGTIASADSRTITSTLNDIQVKSLKAAVGDTVTAGQVLVEIETNEAGESVIYVVDTAARSRGNSEGTEETRQDRKSQTTEDRQMLGNSEKPGMPVDGEMPSRGGKGSSTSGNASGTGMNRKAIVVEVGLESDYYTEISSDELKEGMLVITGTATEKTSSDNAEDENAMSGMFDGMSGGGAPGGNGGGRGGMSGGGPGGR